MLDSVNESDREGAINILVESNHPVAFGNLIWNLNHHALERVRQAVAEALGRIGDAAAVPALTKALDDQLPAVRGAAVEALGQIGDAAAVPALTKALDDQQPAVRETAAKALERIEGPRRFKRLRSVIRSVTKRT